MDILIIRIMGRAFPQTFVSRNDISTALGKKLKTEGRNALFIPAWINFNYFFFNIR